MCACACVCVCVCVRVCVCERDRERERKEERVNISKEIWPIISTHHRGVNLLKNVSRQPVFWVIFFRRLRQSGSKANHVGNFSVLLGTE